MIVKLIYWSQSNFKVQNVNVCGVFVQLSADCSNDAPPDYEMSVGGPPTNPISAASEITVNESSVVLDAADQAIGLQQLYPDAEIAPQAGESYIIDSSKCTCHVLTAAS